MQTLRSINNLRLFAVQIFKTLKQHTFWFKSLDIKFQLELLHSIFLDNWIVNGILKAADKGAINKWSPA
jgi:hypothetical protein